MRLLERAAPFTVVAICFGCASIVSTRTPTLEELEDDKVHLQKLKSTEASDVYRFFYRVGFPLDATWDASADVDSWLKDTDLIARITPDTSFEASDEMAPGVEIRRFRVQTKFSPVEYPIVLERNEPQKMVKISSVADSQRSGDFSYCSIRMRQYLDGATLVDANLHVSSDLFMTIGGLFDVPAALLSGRKLESWLDTFANQLATDHREATLGQHRPGLSGLGRTHIIAIGLNEAADANVEHKLNVRPLAYAESDAERFYEWATGELAGPANGGTIRQLLIGPDASSTNIRKVLNELEERCLSGRVREDDTILFFFAGQVASWRNDTVAGDRGYTKYPHLLTVDAQPDRLGSTAILRDDVLDALRLSRASRCLFFCDAPFSGGFRVKSIEAIELGGGAGPDLPDFARIGPSTVIFAADQERGWAAESETPGHGVFTEVLMQGLSGAGDANGDGVSLEELRSYLERGFKEMTGGRQKPFVYIPESIPGSERIRRTAGSVTAGRVVQ